MRGLTLASGQEDSEEHRLGEESEDTLHRQRRADDAARVIREASPVGPELELERDPRDHPNGEVDGEDLGPEP
jgi:hypothetical protein